MKDEIILEEEQREVGRDWKATLFDVLQEVRNSSLVHSLLQLSLEDAAEEADKELEREEKRLKIMLRKLGEF